MTTFEICNIVLNAVVAVLVVGYGLWLRNVFQHQIKAKDATIETKDAEISRLKAETAPAIAEAYSKMRAHADQMTVDANLLSEKLDEQIKSLPQVRLSVEVQLLLREGKRLLMSIEPIPSDDWHATRQLIYQFVYDLFEEAEEKVNEHRRLVGLPEKPKYVLGSSASNHES